MFDHRHTFSSSSFKTPVLTSLSLPGRKFQQWAPKCLWFGYGAVTRKNRVPVSVGKHCFVLAIQEHNGMRILTSQTTGIREPAMSFDESCHCHWPIPLSGYVRIVGGILVAQPNGMANPPVLLSVTLRLTMCQGMSNVFECQAACGCWRPQHIHWVHLFSQLDQWSCSSTGNARSTSIQSTWVWFPISPNFPIFSFKQNYFNFTLFSQLAILRGCYRWQMETYFFALKVTLYVVLCWHVSMLYWFTSSPMRRKRLLG